MKEKVVTLLLNAVNLMEQIMHRSASESGTHTGALSDSSVAVSWR